MTDGIRIRGAGMVCALGVGAAAVRATVAAGREHAAFTGPSTVRAAYPAPFDPVRDLPRGLGRRLGRQLAMSLAAVLDALDSQRAWDEDAADTGLVAATAHGPIHETVDFIAGARRSGPRFASPLLFSGAQHNAMVGCISRELELRGPAIVVSNGESSFETALLAAVAGLRAGRMRRAIVVGADAYHPVYAKSLEQFGLISDAVEPVDATMRRTMRGLHLGEGSGALFLERAPREPGGVYLDDVALGASAGRPASRPARVQLMATGDTRSARLHHAALAPSDLPVAYPAARFGAFASLSAVAIAVEAARRLSSRDDGPTLSITVPPDANAASCVISGGRAA